MAPFSRIIQGLYRISGEVAKMWIHKEFEALLVRATQVPEQQPRFQGVRQDK